jgi:hypothetical protein
MKTGHDMADNAQGPDGLSVKAMFAALALGSVLAGLVVYVLRERLGIPDDTAQMIATVFIVVATADIALLIFWDRLFKRGD